MLKGACADGLGRREEAVTHYRAATALMVEVPEFSFYDPARSLAQEGTHRALAPGERPMNAWSTHVPQ
jgi:hypothetical protein